MPRVLLGDVTGLRKISIVAGRLRIIMKYKDIHHCRILGTNLNRRHWVLSCKWYDDTSRKANPVSF